MAPGVPASAQAIGMPGKPAPDPKSTQTRASGARARSWSESAICRVQIRGSVDLATRLIFSCPSNSRSTNVSRRSCVSRETGVSASARFLSASRSKPPCPSFIKRVSRRFCRVSHARPKASAPPASCRRSCSACPIVRGRFFCSFCLASFDKPAKRRIIEIVRQRKTFIAPIRRDVRGLARQIDVVLRVDLDLLGDFFVELAEARPDFREIRNRNVRIRQQLERRAALAVFVEREAVTLGFFRRQRN